MDRTLHPRGFTLIELMIVVAVIALLAAAAAPALGGLTGADARKGAGQLAGGMRWLFDGASVRHATCRLVLSPAERSWWAECASGHRTIAREPEGEGAGRATEEGEGAKGEGEIAGFAKFEDPIAGKRELPGAASFKAIRIDGHDFTEGQTASIHFFPGGRAQAARVTIADGGNVYTVRLEPYTGRARVIAGEPTGRDE